MKVTIIGLGLIGGSLALALRQAGLAHDMNGVDSNENHQHQALSLKLVDRILPWQDALEADLVVIAIPVHEIAKVLPQILAAVGEKTTVVDMGSTKVAIAKSVAGHAKRNQFVAAHPMAGTEYSGPQAAIADLFTGRTAVICDSDQSGESHLERIEQMFTALQMRIVQMTSQAHDLHAAFVSHLSHVSSFVLANTVLDLEKNMGTIFDLAGGGFASTVRLAKSSPSMWRPIFEQNREHVLEALDSYMIHLEHFRQSLVERDFDRTDRLMNQANQIRRVLDTIGALKGRK